MAEGKVLVREIKIGTTHTISFPNYENIKVEASLTFGVPVGCTDEEFTTYMQDAQARLRKIIQQTYIAQKRQKHAGVEYTS